MSRRLTILACLCALLVRAGSDGKDLFDRRCGGCHSAEKDKVGPRLAGVFGRAERQHGGRSTVVLVREWLSPKSRCSGWEPVTLDDRDVPGLPSRTLLSGGVEEQLAIDGVADRVCRGIG